MKKHLSWTNVWICALMAPAISYMIWQSVDARTVIFFVVFLAISDIFIHVRWRLALPCPHCGFDPVLYKTRRELAVDQVRKKLDHVRTSGSHLLKKNNPFQNLPTIRVKPDTEERTIRRI